MKRDTSIDMLKCIAAIVITNSHMDLLYGQYSALATGGAIGDALFFFCSGYTLFLGRNAGFFDWYKRRVNRIYPTVFAWALLSCVLFGVHDDICTILMNGGGWFVSCIMIYYVILWFVKTYAINHLGKVAALAVACIFLWYFTIGIDASNNNIYGECHFKWVHYFIFMLFGAAVGLGKVRGGKGEKVKRLEGEEVKGFGGEKRVPSFLWTMVKLLVCVVAFYGLCWFKNRDGIYDFVQMGSLIPLIGVTYYFWQLCNTKLATRVYNDMVGGAFIKFIGGLCLEIYLVQGKLFSDALNFMFPLNIPVFFVIIVCVAYILRCFARIWSQTFKDGDYEWKEVVRLY